MTKMCLKDGVWQRVCVCVTKGEEEAAETEEEAEPGGTDPKTRTHTTM